MNNYKNPLYRENRKWTFGVVELKEGFDMDAKG